MAMQPYCVKVRLAHCVNLVGSFNCSCLEGYDGNATVLCESKISCTAACLCIQYQSNIIMPNSTAYILFSFVLAQILMNVLKIAISAVRMQIVQTQLEGISVTANLVTLETDSHAVSYVCACVCVCACSS